MSSSNQRVNSTSPGPAGSERTHLRRWSIAGFLVACVITVAVAVLLPSRSAARSGLAASRPNEAVDNADILRIAYSFPNGGGYASDGSGVPEDILYGGKQILAKSAVGTYCCGFTFAVVMRAAGERGLLNQVTEDEVRSFQKEWYGTWAARQASKDERLLVTALERLGIGYQVAAEDARPGDFVQFWRATTGHSVVFVRWVEKDGEIVGITYRSSQRGGIGDQTEFFTDGSDNRGVNPDRIYVGRLSRRAPQPKGS